MSTKCASYHDTCDCAQCESDRAERTIKIIEAQNSSLRCMISEGRQVGDAKALLEKNAQDIKRLSKAVI